MTAKKPRAQFCWECGLQLYQRKVHVEMVVDGHPRILHKDCAKLITKGKRSEYSSKAELTEGLED